jgi:glucose-1-phosphate adenylyltransferase
MATDSAGELREFQEKPERPAPMATDAGRAYASMGNYLFNPGILLEVLDQANRRGDTDFGRHILPRLLHSHRVFAYDFAGNRVPGVRPQEERGYWRDIGTIEAYQAAQQDVLGQFPRFNLVNPQWPLHGDAGQERKRMAPRAAMAAAGTPHFNTRAGALRPQPER